MNDFFLFFFFRERPDFVMADKRQRTSDDLGPDLSAATCSKVAKLSEVEEETVESDHEAKGNPQEEGGASTKLLLSNVSEAGTSKLVLLSLFKKKKN